MASNKIWQVVYTDGTISEPLVKLEARTRAAMSFGAYATLINPPTERLRKK